MDNALIEQKFNSLAQESEDLFLTVFKNKETLLQEKEFARMQIKNNPAIMNCPKDSVIDAIVNVALTGTTLDPSMQFAFLIPRRNKKTQRTECNLDISYRGLAGIAVDSGSVLDIDATVVHKRDIFDYEMGLNEKLKHKPCLEADPGPMTHVYAKAILLNGVKKFIVLNRAEVEYIRSRSQAPNSDMWANFFDEGCRKTAVKKLYKLLPKTKQTSQAIMVVNAQEGIEFEKPIKTTDDVEYKQPEFGPPELLKELNALFDVLAISQAERDMQLGDCGGDVEKLKALEIDLFKEIEARKALDPPKPERTPYPGPQERVEEPAGEDGEISDSQIKTIQTLFSNAGVKDRVDRLKKLAQILNRTISTTKELTKQEASKVIEVLQEGK